LLCAVPGTVASSQIAVTLLLLNNVLSYP
jgi:hypothetical protein